MKTTDGACGTGSGNGTSRVSLSQEFCQSSVRPLKLLALLLAMSVVCGTLQAETHTVEYGESLWRIAKKHYGDGEKWRWIWAVNRARVRNPNHIRPGMRLTIPSSYQKPQMASSDVPAGYEYGKTALMDNAWIMDGVAVAFSFIPRRAMMKIPGVGWKEADDTGPSPKRGARRGQYRIEIRMASHWNARKWGKQWLMVEIYRKVRKFASGSELKSKSPQS